MPYLTPFFEACFDRLSDNLEKRAAHPYFHELVKQAADTAKAWRFVRMAAPSLVGTGAALTAGGLYAGHKVSEAKENAKKLAIGGLAALGAAGALYGAHKAISKEAALKHGLNFAQKYCTSEDFTKLSACFYLDELLTKSASVELLACNNKMLRDVAYSCLEKIAAGAAQEAANTPASATPGAASDASAMQGAPASPGVPAEQDPAMMAQDPNMMGMAPQMPYEPTEEELAAGGPRNMQETADYNMQRMSTGSPLQDAQLQIQDESMQLEGLTKAIQDAAIRGEAPNPQIQAAALLHQNKINMLQNYMNSVQAQLLQEQQMAMMDPMMGGAPVDPSMGGAPVDPGLGGAPVDPSMSGAPADPNAGTASQDAAPAGEVPSDKEKKADDGTSDKGTKSDKPQPKKEITTSKTEKHY